MTHQKTVLITGGAGYIGSHSAWACYQAGYKVIIIDNYSHQQTFNPPWATIYPHDMGNTEILHHIFTHYTIDAVIHCAASIEVAQSVSKPLAYYDNNVAKTITLLQIMQQYTVKQLVFSSSCAVYGNPLDERFDEEHPQNPLSPYARSKAMIETVLQDCAQAYGLEYISLRYFNAAGAYAQEGLGEQHFHETHIIPLLLQAAYTKKPFIVFGTDYKTKDGTAIRDYVHVRDIAHAHRLSLAHLQRNHCCDTFNIGTGIGYSVKELITMVEQVCQQPIKIIYQQRRPGDAHQLLANPMKAKNILGWQPQYSDLAFIIKSAHAYSSIQQMIIKPTMIRV